MYIGCAVDGCDRPHQARNLCQAHYKRLMRIGEIGRSDFQTRAVNAGLCRSVVCERPAVTKGLCDGHYQRTLHGNGDLSSRISKKRRPGEGGRWIDNHGYVILTLPEQDGRRVSEQRYVMEQKLGRRLLPGENVHHVNGVKTDNRPENLELWVSYQPAGQRVDDLLAWADEVIARYR